MKKCGLNILLLFLIFNTSYGQSPMSYSINQKIQIPGEGGWDYLTIDEGTDRLFVSHKTVVQVVDVKTGKIIATIADLNGVHGIALALPFKKGFISSGKDSSVVVFDLNTYEVISRLKVTGANPDAILYDNFSKKVFVFNAKSSNATVIDATTNQIVGTISLTGAPEFAVTNEKGTIYVNIEDKNEIDVINSSTLEVEHHWPIPPSEEPSGLAIDNVTHRLFSVCDKKMVIVDALNGSVIASLPIGERVDGVAFDPELKRAYSSNGDGTVTVVQEINENSFKVLENIKTQLGARTITVNKLTHHLYLPTAEFGETPEKTEENPHPRPKLIPGSFVVLDIGYNSK